MGHIPTIVVACLASALSALYFVLPVALHFTMVVFISAAWFLVVICWLAQKSADYMHGPQGHGHEHEEKKKLASNVSHQQHTVQISPNEISQAKARLSAELDDLISSLKNKDTEIENLKVEIANLQTLVEIEKLKTELANLKTCVVKEHSKNRK